MNISFVIIQWGNIDNLLKLIKSIEIQFPEPEIIVVNNGPNKINYSCFDNIGGTYPSAVNIGVRKSKKKWIMLLSPAVELLENFKNYLEQYFKKYNNINIFAPKIIDRNFNIKPSLRRNYSIRNHLLRKWKIPISSYPKEDKYVEQPMSAALIVKRKFLIKFPFDERFRLYFSDVDWCRKTIKNNEKILYCTDLKVFHEFGATTKKLGFKRRIIHFKDYLKYLKKIYLKS